MYLKNLTRSLRVRISDDDFLWVSMWADELGISVSDFIRQLIRKDKAQTIAEADEDFISYLENLDPEFIEDDSQGGEYDADKSADIIHIL